MKYLNKSVLGINNNSQIKIYVFLVLWLISFKSFSQKNYWKVSKESVEINEKSSENAFNGGI